MICQISDTGQLCVIFLLYKYITFFLNCKGKRRERGNRSSLIKAYIVIDASIHPNGTNVDETLASTDIVSVKICNAFCIKTARIFVENRE